MKKGKMFYSAILVIGACCVSVGLGNCAAYLTGNYDLTRWLGNVPMAFSTSVGFTCIGLALYLTGKILIRHGKAIGQI